MVKSKLSDNKWKITKICQVFPEIEWSEMHEYLKEQKESAIRGFKKTEIMEAVESAQEIYTMCENSFIDFLYSLCKRDTT